MFQLGGHENFVSHRWSTANDGKSKDDEGRSVTDLIYNCPEICLLENTKTKNGLNHDSLCPDRNLYQVPLEYEVNSGDHYAGAVTVQHEQCRVYKAKQLRVEFRRYSVATQQGAFECVVTDM